MMNLLLMSDTTSSLDVEKQFFHELPLKPKSLSYLPANIEKNLKEFKKISMHFEKLDVEEFHYCPLHQGNPEIILESIFQSDLLYFSGGEVTTFLKTLQKIGLFQALKDKIQNIVIIGVSAGAMVLGKDISSISKDPHEMEIYKTLSSDLGAGLYPFEFFPHFDPRPNMINGLKLRSKFLGEKSNRSIVAVDEKSGIAINSKRTFVYGQAHLFKKERYSRFDNTRLPF